MGGYYYPYIFGNYEHGTQSRTFCYSNGKAVSKFNLVSADDIYNLIIYSSIDDPTPSVKGVIYSDNSGQPDALIDVTNEVTGLLKGWNVLSFASYVSLSAGYYWLGAISNLNVYSLATFIGSGASRYNADTYADGPSDPFGTHTNDYYDKSIYATGEPIPVIEFSNIISGVVTHPPDMSISNLGSRIVTHPPDISISNILVNVVTNEKRIKQANVMVIT